MLAHCQTVLVLEELEPIVERSLYVEAQRMGWQGRIIGKEAGGGDRALYERVGEYGVRHIFAGLNAALPELALPAGLPQGRRARTSSRRPGPITVCAGCPHRGIFMAINQAVRKAGYKKDEVMVTGDIGCTILGMNPPFNTVWNEVSMGASIRLAQGYVHAGAQDARDRHHRRLDLLPCRHRGPGQCGAAPDAHHSDHHGQRLDEHDRDAGQPRHRAARQPGSGRPVDIARIVPALGVDFFVDGRSL